MKPFAANDSTITINRYNHECALIHTVMDLSMTLIPMGIQLLRSAAGAAPESPGFMAAFSMYGVIVNQWNTTIQIAQELAEDEPKYRAALPALGLNANPDLRASSVGMLGELEVQMRQWRLNLHKFIAAIDPTSPFLKVHHTFDPDPPSNPSRP